MTRIHAAVASAFVSMVVPGQRIARALVYGVSLAWALAGAHAAYAQPAPPATPAAGAVNSPRGALRAFADAAAEERWDDAARALALPADRQPDGPRLAARLYAVLERARLLDAEALSDSPFGRTDDGLVSDLELVGEVGFDAGSPPVRMERSGAPPEWRFSPGTVAGIDDWYAHLPDRWIRERVQATRLGFLLRTGPLRVLWWHWLALPFVALVAVALALALKVGTGRVLRLVTARTATPWDDRLLTTVGAPLLIMTSVVLFAVGCVLLDVTSDATTLLGSVLRPTMALALFWSFWRVSVLVEAWFLEQPWARVSPSARSLLIVGGRVVRGGLVLMGGLSVVASSGYPVGTLLAGLGIGGLALALGAQKTLEHLFGTIALAIDQPFRIGDFVRVDNFVGTVEQIGLRSTRFRTLERTVITIPNGRLADLRLESLQARDRMLLSTTVSLTYDTTRAQAKAVLAGLERVLKQHPQVWPGGTVVRLAALSASAIDIEVMAWFEVPDWSHFQVCREEVLLDFLQVVEEAGAHLAFPTSTVHLVNETATRSPS